MSDVARRTSSGSQLTPPRNSSERPSGLRTPPYSVYTLRRGDREILLYEGDTLIGRSTECSLILDGALVSRRHAVITVQGEEVTLRDLNSRNGTTVNGRHLEGVTQLRAQDRFMVGDVELELVRRSVPGEVSGNDVRQTQAIEGTRSERSTALEEPDENTRAGHAFELLGGVVEKALAMGRPAEAVRLLEHPINRTWRDAKIGRTVDPKIADSAAEYAVRLGEATNEDDWITKAIDIFVAQRRPLPLPVIDRLYSLLRRLPRHRSLLAGYVKDLQSQRDALSAAERFALQRLEGLIRIASL